MILAGIRDLNPSSRSRHRHRSAINEYHRAARTDLQNPSSERRTQFWHGTELATARLGWVQPHWISCRCQASSVAGVTIHWTRTAKGQEAGQRGQAHPVWPGRARPAVHLTTQPRGLMAQGQQFLEDVIVVASQAQQGVETLHSDR
jgi:hypothetical protein